MLDLGFKGLNSFETNFAAFCYMAPEQHFGEACWLHLRPSRTAVWMPNIALNEQAWLWKLINLLQSVKELAGNGRPEFPAKTSYGLQSCGTWRRVVCVSTLYSTRVHVFPSRNKFNSPFNALTHTNINISMIMYCQSGINSTSRVKLNRP